MGNKLETAAIMIIPDEGRLYVWRSSDCRNHVCLVIEVEWLQPNWVRVVHTVDGQLFKRMYTLNAMDGVIGSWDYFWKELE